MKSFEAGSLQAKSPERLVQNYENSRISPDPVFSELYSDYARDMEKTSALQHKFKSDENEVRTGTVAEALVYSLLTKHEIKEHLQFRPTSHYDDYFHGADVLVEPTRGFVQALAALDITINQQDIKGVERRETPARESRPVGLENKLIRAKRYTDHLAEIDPSVARDLSGWINSGGLHEPRGPQNKDYFREAEQLFLMKYYKTPDTAPDPQKPGFVIGGPQTIISLDSFFVNKALQGRKADEDMVADLSVLEFAYCVEAEQAYLNEKVRNNKTRNIFFDTHYTKVKAWSTIFERPELKDLTERLVSKNAGNREFREQLSYYAKTFEKVMKQ